MLTREVKALMDEGLKEAREGRYKIAMELYDQALMNYPTYAEAWAWKAAAYAQLNKFRDALDCAEQAITADPCYEWGYFRKARTLESMGEIMAAYAVYLRAVEINPDFHMASQRVKDLKMKLGM
jgi:tetratricopeptide (TPR) repeat protein